MSSGAGTGLLLGVRVCLALESLQGGVRGRLALGGLQVGVRGRLALGGLQVGWGQNPVSVSF